MLTFKKTDTDHITSVYKGNQFIGELYIYDNAEYENSFLASDTIWSLNTEELEQIVEKIKVYNQCTPIVEVW